MNCVSLGMVSSLALRRSPDCFLRGPMHEFRITLDDKFSTLATGKLSSQKLRSLVKSLEKEKIIFRGSVTPDDFKKSRIFGPKGGQITPLPENVLSEIFYGYSNKNEMQKTSATEQIELFCEHDSFTGMSANIKIPDKFLPDTNEEEFILIDNRFVKNIKKLNTGILFKMAKEKASAIHEMEVHASYICSSSESDYIHHLEKTIFEDYYFVWGKKSLENARERLINFLQNVNLCEIQADKKKLIAKEAEEIRLNIDSQVPETYYFYDQLQKEGFTLEIPKRFCKEFDFVVIGNKFDFDKINFYQLFLIAEQAATRDVETHLSESQFIAILKCEFHRAHRNEFENNAYQPHIQKTKDEIRKMLITFIKNSG